jgi:hypothetical protein
MTAQPPPQPPPEIPPDTKDWTWVLERPCPECGFDTRTLGRADIGPALRDNAAAWPALLAGPEAQVRGRPTPTTWSPLEYACHVRDVFRLYDERLALMLGSDDPGGARFANWDQDRTAVEERYGDQDPATVARDLVDAGEALAASFDRVSGDQWERTGTRSDGARFTVDTFARYLVHDPVHHLHDVTGGPAS